MEKISIIKKGREKGGEREIETKHVHLIDIILYK